MWRYCSESRTWNSLCGKGLNVCHWNVQHLTDSKLEEIRVLLTSPNNKEEKPDILILTETFCSVKVPDSLHSTPGYQIYRKDRIGKSGGGILANVNVSLQGNRREDLEEIDLECLWLDTHPYKLKRPLLIGGIYHPPSYEDDKRLGKNFENAWLLNRDIIILGDFNIDFLSTEKFQKHLLVKAMRNLSKSQLVHVIIRPVSNSCLEHIWSSHLECLYNVRNMSSGMSNHLPFNVNRKFLCLTNNGKQHTITYGNVKSLNKEQFVLSLHEPPWDCVFVFEDANAHCNEPFQGICKQRDHLAVIRIDQPSNVLFVEDTGEPSGAVDAEDASETRISLEQCVSGETRGLPEVCLYFTELLDLKSLHTTN